jgi:hypothetical protein
MNQRFADGTRTEPLSARKAVHFRITAPLRSQLATAEPGTPISPLHEEEFLPARQGAVDERLLPACRRVHHVITDQPE